MTSRGKVIHPLPSLKVKKLLFDVCGNVFLTKRAQIHFPYDGVEPNSMS